MEHSKNYEKAKGYYDNGLWGRDRVFSAVGKWITPEEYAEITSGFFETGLDGKA